jgi:hypothetical protein
MPGRGPLNIHATAPGRGKNASLKTGLHGTAYIPDSRLPPGIVQEDFGENEVEGGRGCPRFGLNRLPIAPVLGKLVAGYNGPLRKVSPRPGEQNLRNRGAQSRKTPVYIIHNVLLIVLVYIQAPKVKTLAPGS